MKTDSRGPSSQQKLLSKWRTAWKTSKRDRVVHLQLEKTLKGIFKHSKCTSDNSYEIGHNVVDLRFSLSVRFTSWGWDSARKVLLRWHSIQFIFRLQHICPFGQLHQAFSLKHVFFLLQASATWANLSTSLLKFRVSGWMKEFLWRMWAEWPLTLAKLVSLMTKEPDMPWLKSLIWLEGLALYFKRSKS